MPPRFAYWTILVDGQPTAFRAAEVDELLPTLKRLQVKQPTAEMKWFERGRLWASRDEARDLLRRRLHGGARRHARAARRQRIGARAGGPAASIATRARSTSWRRRRSGRSSSRWCARGPATDLDATRRAPPTTRRHRTIRPGTIGRLPFRRPPTGGAVQCPTAGAPASGAPAQRPRATRSRRGATRAGPRGPQARVARSRARARGPSPSGATGPEPRTAGPSRNGAIAAPPRVDPSPSGATAGPNLRAVGPSRNGAIAAPARVGPSPSGVTAGPNLRAGPQAGMARSRPRRPWSQARVARPRAQT